MTGSASVLTSRPLRTAVTAFNSGSPEEALRAAGAISDEDAAGFLHDVAGLDMTVVGELLGCTGHQTLLGAYVRAINFRGLSLDKGLRLLLRGFRLPGEAQQVDRILHVFAHQWHRQTVGVLESPSSDVSAQPSVSGSSTPNASLSTNGTHGTLQISADAAHVLAFALVILNTDLHNPAIRRSRRMTVEQFVRNVRGAGPDVSQLPRALLVKLYRGIAAREITLTGEGFTLGASRELIRSRQLLQAPRNLVTLLMRILTSNRASNASGARSAAVERSAGGSVAGERASDGSDVEEEVSASVRCNSYGSCESGDAVESGSVCGGSVCSGSTCADSVCGSSTISGRSPAPSSRSAARTELGDVHVREESRHTGDARPVGVGRLVSDEHSEDCSCSVAADDLNCFAELWDDEPPLRPIPVFEIRPPSDERAATSLVPAICMPPLPSGKRRDGATGVHPASKGATASTADHSHRLDAAQPHAVTSCAACSACYASSGTSTSTSTTKAGVAAATVITTTTSSVGLKYMSRMSRARMANRVHRAAGRTATHSVHSSPNDDAEEDCGFSRI